MSERDEEELSPEAKAFLSRHASTGEPSADALERGKQRLVSPGVPKTVRSMRRSRFPPEVMAAAAVVVLLLGAQLLYLALRAPKISAESPPVPKEEVKAVATSGADLKAIAEAWRAGDFTKARRLASKECQSAGCGELNSELGEMLGLARHLDTLSDDELSRLSAFDKKLSDGRDSAMKRQLENRPHKRAPVLTSPAAQAQAEALYEEGRNERTAKNYDRAITQLEKCIKVAPGYFPCYRQLGSAYAAVATRDQSASDMERARKYYERFLEIAPADDEYVPKVRAILDSAKDDSATPARAIATRFPLGSEGDITFPQEIKRVVLGEPGIADITQKNSHELHVKGLVSGKTTLLVAFMSGDAQTVSVEVAGSESDAAKRSLLFADATRAKLTGNWALAITLALKVLDADPNHRGARAIVDEGRGQAKDAYLRGYQLRDANPEEALKLFKFVVSVTPADDDTHHKAQVRINELEGDGL